MRSRRGMGGVSIISILFGYYRHDMIDKPRQTTKHGQPWANRPGVAREVASLPDTTVSLDDVPWKSPTMDARIKELNIVVVAIGQGGRNVSTEMVSNVIV